MGHRHRRRALLVAADLHGWGDHFTIILYLMAPLYWAVPSVVAMLVVQCVALAMGAFAVWGLARRLLDDDRLAAVLFLVNPTLHGINLRDFRPQAFAIPLLALAVRRRPGTGVATAVFALAWLVMATRWAIPFFREETYSHLWRWGHLGESIDAIVLGMLTRPGEVLGFVFGLGRLRYLAAMLAPWAFLPLLGPLALVPALPPLAANVLSADPVLFHHRTQYGGYLLPFLTLSAIAGIGRLAAWKGERAVRLALGLVFIVSIAMTARTVNGLMVSRWWPDARTRNVHALVAMVPPGVVVGTEERIVPHLAHRPHVYIFPQRLESCEWVLVDVGPGSEYSFREYRPERVGTQVTFRSKAAVEHTFTVVAERGSLLLLARRPTPRRHHVHAIRSVRFGRQPQPVGGVVMDEPPALVVALEQVGGEDGRHTHAATDLGQDVLGAGDPGEVATDVHVDLGQREAHLLGVREDRLPRRADGVPAAQQWPARVHAARVLAVHPHPVHLGDVERLEGAIEVGVGLLDVGGVAHGQVTTSRSPSRRSGRGASASPTQGPAVQRPLRGS